MRHKIPNLASEILENPQRFEFFELARWVNLLKKSSGFPDNLTVAYKSQPTRTFPSQQVAAVERTGDTISVSTPVIGLNGPIGVLPHHDKASVTGRAKSEELLAFLDIFNQRIIELFFETWKKNRPDIAFESTQRTAAEKQDSCSLILLSLCGMFLDETRNQGLIPDRAFASLTGLLCRPVRSANAIEQCIKYKFGLKVSLHEFVVDKLTVPYEKRTRINSSGQGFNVLGGTAMLGSRVESHRQRFEIRLGPLNKNEFDLFCPYGSNLSFRRLIDLVKGVLGRPLDFNIRFAIQPNYIRGTELGKSRLGFNTWLVEKPNSTELSDPVFQFDWQKTCIGE